jgi:alpha-N-arabinofuranosidase
MKPASAIVTAFALAIQFLGASPLALKLDATKTGAPINPFIYGQFIEHLGRCIYGGIWAEMLEDRKFYFPITADYSPYRDLVDSDYPVVGSSPWQIIGEANSVSMEKKGAFVGEHSPRLNSGAGIRQRDLGLVAGKSYDGYLWAKPLSGRTVVDVTLAWGNSPEDRVSRKLTFEGGEYTKQSFSFTAASGRRTWG